LLFIYDSKWKTLSKSEHDNIFNIVME